MPRDDVKAKKKCSHKLGLPGHSFIITKHENNSTIFNLFSFKEWSKKAFLTIKLEKNVADFSEKLKSHLKGKQLNFIADVMKHAFILWMLKSQVIVIPGS